MLFFLFLDDSGVEGEWGKFIMPIFELVVKLFYDFDSVDAIAVYRTKYKYK